MYKTDLNVATLEDWKLKVLTFMRRRYPQFGALLQLAWTEENNERLLEIISDNEYAATANMWGASALLALIEVTKPKGKVFEHELLELERQVPGTTSSGIEIAARLGSLLTARHTGDEEADLKKLEATQYLKLGMDKDSIKLAIALLQSHLRISPKRVREAPHALFRWILKKVPNEIKEKCDLITERINIAEAAGENVEPIYNGSVLTLQSLSNELVEYIKKASTKVQNEVSAAEREKRKKLQVTEWAKKPPCTMCASTTHGWGGSPLQVQGDRRSGGRPQPHPEDGGCAGPTDAHGRSDAQASCMGQRLLFACALIRRADQEPQGGSPSDAHEGPSAHGQAC